MTFTFDPNVARANAGEILVGIGSSEDDEQEGLVLNPKYPDSPFRSVSGYVWANAATRSHWQDRLRKGMAGVRRIVLEDLSLDTCFSLILFRQLMGEGDLVEPSSDHVEKWCDYVSRWEDGYTREQRPWTESIAYLVTALGHSYLDLQGVGKEAPIDPGKFNDGAHACLELVNAAFLQGGSPTRIDLARLEHSEAFLRARNHVEYERSQYNLARQHGKQCQLSLPLATSGKSMLVDALFLEEPNPSGLLKMFARSDRENTWTRRGFDVLGLFRPKEVGTGGDMTISLAPELGLTLKSLWKKLEQLEDERWGEARPKDEPRKIASYHHSAISPNQPWWDHYGTYSLLGAPKNVRIGDRTEPGSRLHWYDDVLPAVWRCYSPIPEQTIAWTPPIADVGSKKLRYGTWVHEAAAQPDPEAAPPIPFIADCPTFRGWLKAMSSPGGDITSPMNVPPESSYRVMSIDGGLLLVHRDGVTAFKDWTHSQLPVDGVTRIFRDMAEACDYFAKFHESCSLEDALEYQQKLLDSRTFRLKEFEHWKIHTWHARANALKAGVKALNHADGWPLNEFRRLLISSWGFDEQRQETLESIDRIDYATAEVALELRERRTKLFQAIGAGLALSIVGKEVFEAVQYAAGASPYDWQWKIFLWLKLTPLKELEDLHHSFELWHFGALLIMALAGFSGFWFYRTFGTKTLKDD